MLKRLLFLLAFIGTLGAARMNLRADAPAGQAATMEFFEKQVRPLLVNRCFKCHGDEKPKAGLQLTSRQAVLTGGDSGPAAVPGKPQDSLLVKAIRRESELQMPPKEKLPASEIETLTRWVQLGLPWPENKQVALRGDEFLITDAHRSFWSFQPIRAISPPIAKDTTWPKAEIDRFIINGLAGNGLKPAPPADRRTLIRQATFDLTGLPPTPEEIDAFLRDDSTEAFAKVVDRLLASPHYGERWGRHWLDVVRYADSFDARFLTLAPDADIIEAWRYRDWIVNAFNRDLPYDQFTIHQIAGDLLPPKEPGHVNTDGIVATGMLVIGEWGTGDADKEKMLTDIVDDQIDVVSKAFLGLTVSCARCHDHKFDPIPTKDYYGLAGIFFSTHILPDPGDKTNASPLLKIPLASQAEIDKRKKHEQRIAEAEKKLKTGTEEQYRAFARELLPQTARYVTAAWEFKNRPPEQAKMSLTEFASQRGLMEYALRQWLTYLSAGNYQLLAKPVRDFLGNAGIHSWQGMADCPSLTVNTTDNEVMLYSFKLPAKSVAAHPGPTAGIAVGWKSPITGKVKVTGEVKDIDPSGGDGIGWALLHRAEAGIRQLRSGEVANGGTKDLTKGDIDVKAGEMIQLHVLPRKEYTCDTTLIQFAISKEDGTATWDLRADIVEDPLHGNPHTDRQGNAGVWHFFDMAGHQESADKQGLLAEKDRTKVEQQAQAIQNSFTSTDSSSPFWISNVEDQKHLSEAARAHLAGLAAEHEQLKKTLPPPIPVAHGAREGGVPKSAYAGIKDAPVHIRGSYTRLGEVVPRHFPRVIAGDHQPTIKNGSGRIDLARWIASPDNPLTARVMVNRIWQYHFGEGIVRTPSNFGKLGERPTHPQLLDYLARQFIQSGWSIKAMHRKIMLSATYQQSSKPWPETLLADPDNRLWGRTNRRRLEAEAIRDSLLAVAGRLDRRMGGVATREPNDPRRTLYHMTIRSDRTGFRPLFDSPDSTASVDKRTISTVAPQALFMLNDAFVVEQTRAFAKRIEKERPKDNRKKIERAYAILYGRPPTDEEIQIGMEFLAKREAKGWEEYCQILLCANEFVYLD